MLLIVSKGSTFCNTYDSTWFNVVNFFEMNEEEVIRGKTTIKKQKRINLCCGKKLFLIK
jgi:hypothetical protein